jgi:5-formyltetrahydrofolate cyclo-ligase
MLFAPLPDEVDLTPVLQRCRETGRRVCVARANWETRITEPAEVGGSLLEELAPARHGVREPPAAAPLVPLEEIDLVLVPALAFDTGCHRLGRGGGFYDRFLARAELRRAFLLGVGFGVQLVTSVPRSEHDRPVDAVVTDTDLVVRRNTTRDVL